MHFEEQSLTLIQNLDRDLKIGRIVRVENVLLVSKRLINGNHRIEIRI